MWLLPHITYHPMRDNVLLVWRHLRLAIPPYFDAFLDILREPCPLFTN
jgi:hypothetical protein